MDESSATVGAPNEEIIPVLYADHVSICKIPSGDCNEFRVVAQKIINMVHNLVQAPAKCLGESACEL